MEALRIIKDEHRNLWRVATTVERVIGDMEAAGKADAAFLGSVFDYFEQFVDDCHHPKEDDYLFRLLRQRSPEAAAVLDRLEAEHRDAPANLKGLRNKLALAESGRLPVSDLAEALRGYWDGLSDGGTVGVPLEQQMWGDMFGQLTDRFGVSWMVNIAGAGQA